MAYFRGFCKGPPLTREGIPRIEGGMRWSSRAAFECRKTRDLAINGNDIMREFGLAPGPVVGQVLSHLLEAVLDEPSVNQRESLIRLAREYLKTRE